MDLNYISYTILGCQWFFRVKVELVLMVGQLKARLVAKTVQVFGLDYGDIKGSPGKGLIFEDKGHIQVVGY